MECQDKFKSQIKREECCVKRIKSQFDQQGIEIGKEYTIAEGHVISSEDIKINHEALNY